MLNGDDINYPLLVGSICCVGQKRTPVDGYDLYSLRSGLFLLHCFSLILSGLPSIRRCF